MRIENFQRPHSSFLSIDKDLDLIITKMLKNDRLKRLLYYPTKDCITNASGKCPNLTDEESIGLIDTQIRTVPRVALNDDIPVYVIISFDNFILNTTNPHFRDNTIEFDIVCDFDQWRIADGQLRPYRIAGEIDSMFNNTHLSGIGTLEFLGAKQENINDTCACVSLIYMAIHGDEDVKDMLSAQADEQFQREFNANWNNQ
jgi:hypothetical protein